MTGKQLVRCLWIALIGVILVSLPAIAGDDSDLAGRAKKWEADYNAGNMEAVAAMYASDGCRMPPNAPAAKGRDAVLANLKQGREMGMAKIKIAVTEAETSGDWGSGTGTYEVLKADGSHLDHGKWMNESRKIDGEWKILCDIWNSDMPLPAPPAK